MEVFFKKNYFALHLEKIKLLTALSQWIPPNATLSLAYGFQDIFFLNLVYLSASKCIFSFMTVG